MASRGTTDDAPSNAGEGAEEEASVQDARQWHAEGWTARIIKNEDDEGWAVEMTADGESEPALVGPWTMGRDKKNPKPIDKPGFATLLKGANEVRARHTQLRDAQMHKSVTATAPDGSRMKVLLDVANDEDDPHAMLTVEDKSGDVVSRTRVAASFKLTSESARQWLEGGERDG